jgi:hypothetical protein
MSNERHNSSLLKMGKRPLPSAPPSVPLEKLEAEFLGVPPAVQPSGNTAVQQGAEVTETQAGVGGLEAPRHLLSIVRPPDTGDSLPLEINPEPHAAVQPYRRHDVQQSVVSEEPAPSRAPNAPNPTTLEIRPSQPDSRTAVQMAPPVPVANVAPLPPSTGTKLIPRTTRQRVATVSSTFRLPEPLHTRLKRISQYNRVDMTDITIEALEIHLNNFPDPGEGKYPAGIGEAGSPSR